MWVLINLLYVISFCTEEQKKLLKHTAAKFMQIKDTLKVFDDFKISKKVYEVMFLICGSMYALKVYSINYTLG